MISSSTLARRDSALFFAKENHDKIFEAFSQEEDSTSRKYGGTGLGLAISAKLVSLMDSKLELESDVGQGSEFSFTVKTELPEEVDENFTLIPNIGNINVALLCPADKIGYANVLQEYLKSFGMHNLTHPESLETVTPFTHPLLILNSNMYSVNQIQSLLDKGHALIIIKASLSQNFSNIFKGKVSVIDPPFTPSSVHDALLELFLERKEDNSKIETGADFNRDANILIAEDNDANQYLMGVIMKKLGLNYTFANDGLEVIEIFKDGSYDLILMDENMPNMNGTEAAKNILEIEAEENLTHTPIISLTANAIKGDRDRFLEAGMDEYLSKPIVVDNLVLMLKRFLPEADNSSIDSNDTILQKDEVNETESSDVDESREVITIESLASKKGYDAEDIEVILDMFLNSIDIKIEELHEATKNSDYQLLFNTAHTIKGSSGNIGLDDIFNVSESIEINARENNEYEYEDAIHKLEELIEEVKMIKNKDKQ